MHPLNLYQFEYRLALALGAVFGLERQVRHKAAGTKTHALVALGAALFVLLAEGIPGDASAPGRVVGQIITGIGFVGAGAILRRDSSTVTGLTTAATVWCAGAIGTLAGLGSWYQALIGTGFILVANVLLRLLDLLINRLGQPKGAPLEPVEVPGRAGVSRARGRGCAGFAASAYGAPIPSVASRVGARSCCRPRAAVGAGRLVPACAAAGSAAGNLAGAARGGEGAGRRADRTFTTPDGINPGLAEVPATGNVSPE